MVSTSTAAADGRDRSWLWRQRTGSFLNIKEIVSDIDLVRIQVWEYTGSLRVIQRFDVAEGHQLVADLLADAR